MCSVAICFSLGSSYLVFHSGLHWVFGFLTIVLKVLYIFSIQVLCHICDFQIFSPILWVFFTHFKKRLYSFIGETEWAQESGERERVKEKQASHLPSGEPGVGLHPRTLGAIQAPLFTHFWRCSLSSGFNLGDPQFIYFSFYCLCFWCCSWETTALIQGHKDLHLYFLLSTLQFLHLGLWHVLSQYVTYSGVGGGSNIIFLMYEIHLSQYHLW